MALNQLRIGLKNVALTGLTIGGIAACFTFEGINTPNAIAGPAMLEFRWEQDDNYRKLYYSQSSTKRRDRSTYYLVMKPKDRKTGILKLTINFPKHFDATITPRKLSLCRIQMGGMLERTKCTEKIAAVFEVNREEKTTIEVFPNQPIPADKDGYAVLMKIFNPSKAGMSQINAFSQSPGDMPISRYIGSWNVDIR